MPGKGSKVSSTEVTSVCPPVALEDVSFGYMHGQTVISQLSVCLEPGRLCAVIGPNAAGKSTLLRLILGQLRPSSGRVRLCGAEVTTLSPRRRAALVSYVPQQGAVGFAFTVEQVVAMGRFALPLTGSVVERALVFCDLSGLRHRIFSELSIGQQQRVTVARAMAQSYGGGKVMLLDEPVSAMDLWHVHTTMRRLVELRSQGQAVLAVLHDLNLAARYADDVWLLHEGGLVASGSWQQVLRPEVLEPVYGVSLQTVEAQPGDRPLFIVDPEDTMSLD